MSVMNTSSPTLLPTTLLSLRAAAGSARPFAVLVPVWIVSAACSLLAALLTGALGALARDRLTKEREEISPRLSERLSDDA